MSVYKDAFGTTLHEGDLVAHAAHRHTSTDLRPHVIVGFTPKMVKLRAVKPRSLEPLQGHNGCHFDRNVAEHLCVRIDVKAYLGVSE